MKRPSNGLWAGLFVGIVAVTVMMALHVDVNGGGDAPRAPALVTSDRAAQAFVLAWQRMATGTWTVQSTYTRVLANGQKYSAGTKQVQQPPDFVDEGVGAITARIQGRRYVCATADAGHIGACKDNGAAPSFSMLATQQVQSVSSVVSGAHRLYAVESAGSGCFNLFLEPGALANNWGNRAQFCFDPVTGATTTAAFYRDGGTDTTQATQVTAKVDPQDLEVPHL